MKKFLKIIFLVVFVFSITKCTKTDDPIPPVPLRDYATQYAADVIQIENYLKTHKVVVTNNPNFTNDQDATVTVVPSLDPTSIWGTNATTPNANVLSRTIVVDGISYKIYYLQFRQGTGESPCNVDAVLTSYKGFLMDSETTQTVFDSQNLPQTFFPLDGVIRGWSEIFPLFKKGTISVVNGTNVYANFGAGMMFVPSALAYYNQGRGSIPSYAPLVFSFKLYSVDRQDQDGDGIPSYLEDLRGTTVGSMPDGYITVADDDTDGDGKPDYGDFDDDNDNILTKNEIKNPATQLPYAFGSIPICTSGSGKPVHRDAACVVN
jgi:hypothetical protein